MCPVSQSLYVRRRGWTRNGACIEIYCECEVSGVYQPESVFTEPNRDRAAATGFAHGLR